MMLRRAVVIEENRDAVAATLLGGAAVGLTGAHQGGYFAPAWGWSALGLLLAAGLGLAFRNRLEVGAVAGALVCGLGLVLLWTALSSAWSDSAPQTVAEVERTVVYVAAAAAVVAVVPPRRLPFFLGGVLAAIVAIAAYAVAAPTHGPFPGNPLVGPLGYWNALGILVVIGILLALGFATMQLPVVVRIAAAAAVPLLATTLYLTKSRGAFAALVAGLFGFAFLHPLLQPKRRRVAAGAVLALVLVAVGAGIIRAGGPGALLGKTYGAFRGPAAPQGRPNETFLTFSSNNRSEYWRVASKDYAAHPWLGSGAGTFNIYWDRYRRTIYGARDAHSLYVETLAEVGPVGLVLLVLTLLTPFLALRGAGRDPLLAAAASAYLAFLLHAGVDWDWEVPAVTLAGLFCGAGVAVAAGHRRLAVTSRARWGAVAIAAILAAFTSIAYRGNSTAADATRAATRGDYALAEDKARTASSWIPWASEPWRIRGEAQLAAGDAASARASFRTAIGKDSQILKLWYDLALASRGRPREQAIDEAARLNRYSLEVLAFRRR